MKESQEPKSIWQRSLKMLRVMGLTSKLLGVIWSTNRKITILLIGTSIGIALVPICELELVKLLLDAIAKAVTESKPLLTGLSVFLIVAVVVVGWLHQVLYSLNSKWQPELTALVEKQTTTLLLHKANSFQDIAIFENPEYHDKLDKANRQAGILTNGLPYYVTYFVRASFQLMSMVTVLFSFNPLLALWVVALALPGLLTQVKSSKEYRETWDLPELRRARYSQNVITNGRVAKEIRLLGLGDHFLARYINATDSYRNKIRDVHDRQFKTYLFTSSLAALGTGGAFAYVSLLALSKQITIGDFSILSAAVERLSSNISTTIHATRKLYDMNLCMEDLLAFLELPLTMEVLPKEFAQPLPNPIKQGIEFKDVYFGYPKGERKTLDGVTFHIRPGQTVALVGENGAGKTTIVKLLARLYEPTSGKILIDGIDLRDYDLDDWRAHIGIVFQDFAHYQLSARENIGLGAIDLIGNKRAIDRAATIGGARDVIEKLPAGMSTMLGNYFNVKEEKAQSCPEANGKRWLCLELSCGRFHPTVTCHKNSESPPKISRAHRHNS